MTYATEPTFDVLIRGGTVCDGSGGEPFVADVGVRGDRIAAVGRLDGARAGTVLDAAGLTVAPGFINVLSHSYLTLLHDGRGMSELLQGVTTQVFGEGASMGPLNEPLRASLQAADPALNYSVEWTRLSEYLDHAARQGVAQNVASFIGATTLRIHVAGHDNRPLTAAELNTARGLVREEMQEGALGIGSSLIYPPAFFASTEELVELCRAASPYGGGYISHMRSERAGLLQAIDELVRIAREAEVPAEVYHLKAGGHDAWGLMQPAIDRIELARTQGLRITADMYTYTAGATGLSNCIPPWFHEGGPARLFERLADPAVRLEIRAAIEGPGEGWENLYGSAAEPANILILQTRTPELSWAQGKSLAAIAERLGRDPIDALMDVVQQDRSRVTTAYFMMSEENVRLGLSQPWVSLGSDSPAVAAEGVFLTRSTHPRAYGNFARFLRKYVRDEKLVPLGEAVRRMSALPADNLGLVGRGRLTEDAFADIVVFDPATIADRATFEQPQQYAVGVRDVIVNGIPVLRDGAFTGSYSGRALRRGRE